jgi:hypothetical protein
MVSLWGCGDGEGTTDRNERVGGASSSTGGADAGGAAGNDGGMAGRRGAGQSNSGPALLDRPAPARYQCNVERPLELFERPWIFGELVDGAHALVRGVPGPEDDVFARKVLWSPIGVSGGPSDELGVHDAGGHVYSVRGAARNRRTTIVWSQDGPDAINILLAQVDDSGAVITKPYAVAPSENDQSDPQIVATRDGYAIMWSEDPDRWQNDAHETFRFAALDQDGALVRAPVNTLEGMQGRVTQLLWTGTAIAATFFDVTRGQS